MGYTTAFTGRFLLDNPLTKEQAKYLHAFSDTRHMKRSVKQLTRKGNKIRTDVDLPVGIEGEFYIPRTDRGHGYEDSSVEDHNTPPSTQPGLWCQWVPSEDLKGIEWNQAEKFYHYTEWLTYIIKNFLIPWGLTLNGKVLWQGESSSDSGYLRCVNNVVTKESLNLTDSVTY